MGGAVSSISSKNISLENRIKYVKNTPFFLYLQDDTLREFAHCFPKVMNKKEGRIELDQDKVYIVAEGELELWTTVPAQNSSKIENKGYLCMKKPGDIFNKSNIQKDAARKLSAKNKKLESLVDKVQINVKSPTKLLCSDKGQLDKFLKKYQNLNGTINYILSSQIEKRLATLPFLQNVKVSQINVLAAMCRYEALDENQVVFDENTSGSKFYIILSGSASVLAPQGGGSATALQQSLEWGSDERVAALADIKNGEYFGEIALFTNIPRTCTVVTNEKSLFVTVEKTDFANFTRVCDIKESMATVMKERMVSKLSSLGIPFFVGIPPEKLNTLSSSVQIHQVSHDEVIFRQGDMGDRFYIVVHGEVSVETMSENTGDSSAYLEGSSPNKSTVKKLGIIGAGGYFGEMALAYNSPRSATVIAKGRAILLSVDQESFRSIFSSNTQALAEFKLRLLKELSELHHVLDHPLGLSSFRSFLQQCIAEENLEFWLSSKEYEKNNETEIENLRIKAYEIYDLYCSRSAPKEVNIPCGIRTKIQNQLEEGNIDIYLFESAKDEIYKLMVRDNYARFKLSPLFKEFFICLGILINK